MKYFLCRVVLVQVGFEMIDAIAQAENNSLTTIQHKPLLGKGLLARRRYQTPCVLPCAALNAGALADDRNTEETASEPSVSVILLAGGKGKRMGVSHSQHNFEQSLEMPNFSAIS
jgi:hypothetical protein